MLGIYLLVCMAVYFLIELKAYSLVKGGQSSVVLNAEPRTYEVCRRAVMLGVVSRIVAFLGYAGCAWPYLFIKGVDLKVYLLGIFLYGIFPVFVIVYSCYRSIRYGQGSIRINTDEIEFNGITSSLIKVSDIKKINYLYTDVYQIFFKDKHRRFVKLNSDEFYKKKEIYSLMKQLRDCVAESIGRDKSLAHKMNVWPLVTIVQRGVQIMLVLGLIYTSYCCIDYDFIRKDCTERYNALNANSGQSENAWTHYIQVAATCVELEENLQKKIETNVDSGPLDFTDSQKEELKSWFSKNSASWESLKKAASVDYCNAAYEKISLMDKKGRGDFSNPSDDGYAQIRDLYGNAYAGLRSKVFDLNWFDLFKMQLSSTRHFIHGKSFIDQLVGYAMVRKTVTTLAGQEHYEPEDLQNARVLLKERFPAGVPSLSIEGEVLILCSFYDDAINRRKIPVQTPLNLSFLMYGSFTGTEAYTRKCHSAMLEQARKGVEIEPRVSWMIDFSRMRNMLLDLSNSPVGLVYGYSRRASANLLAAYFLIDLEEYKLIKGFYPEDVSGLKEAGFNGELPDDFDSGGKIIYRNDGRRAVLYAVGYNAIDDGGFKDQGGSDMRDDIVYWQREVGGK